MDVAKSAIISPHARIYATRLKVGLQTRIDDGVIITGDVEIGNRVHIGPYVVLHGCGRIVIGDYVGLGPGTCVISDAEDYYGEYLLGPFVPDEFRRRHQAQVTISRYSIIGAQCTVLPGVTIGEGVSLGAQTLARKDCEPWSIYVGSPARRLRGKSNEKYLEKIRALEARDRGEEPHL